MRGLNTLEMRVLWEIDHPRASVGCSEPGAPQYTDQESECVYALTARGLILLVNCDRCVHCHPQITAKGREAISLHKLANDGA